MVFGELCVWGDRASQPQGSIILSVLCSRRGLGTSEARKAGTGGETQGKKEEESPTAACARAASTIPSPRSSEHRGFCIAFGRKILTGTDVRLFMGFVYLTLNKYSNISLKNY